MLFHRTPKHICLWSGVWVSNAGSLMHQHGGLLVGFHSAGSEHVLKYWVSCTAFRMEIPILILVAVSRVPTEACSLSGFFSQFPILVLSRTLRRKCCCAFTLSSFWPPGFSLCLLVTDFTTKMNFSIMFLLLLRAGLPLSQLKVHCWTGNVLVDISWCFTQLSGWNLQGWGGGVNLDSIIAEGISVNLIIEHLPFPHTSSDVLYSVSGREVKQKFGKGRLV